LEKNALPPILFGTIVAQTGIVCGWQRAWRLEDVGLRSDLLWDGELCAAANAAWA
jgi:hypothetical protein